MNLEKIDKYGKNHKRVNKDQKNARIERMIEWISLCKPTGDMLRLAAQEWGVKDRQAETYLKYARARIRERWNNPGRKDFVASALEKMERVAELSIKTNQHSNAIGAVNLQAKLLQITTRDN